MKLAAEVSYFERFAHNLQEYGNKFKSLKFHINGTFDVEDINVWE